MPFAWSNQRLQRTCAGSGDFGCSSREAYFEFTLAATALAYGRIHYISRSNYHFIILSFNFWTVFVTLES